MSLPSTTLVVVERGDNLIQDTLDNDNSSKGHDAAFEFVVVAAVAVGREAVVEVTSAVSAAPVAVNSRTVVVVVAADEPSTKLC